MIIVSFVLVLLGLVTLLLGILGVGDQPMQFIYVSIASSLVAAVLLIIGIFRAKPAPAGSSTVPAGATTWSGSVQGAGGVVPPDPKPDEYPTTQLSDLDDPSSEGDDETEDIATVFPEHGPDEPTVVDEAAWAPPDDGEDADGEDADDPDDEDEPGDEETDEQSETIDEHDVGLDAGDDEESLDDPDEDDEPVEDVREDDLDAAELEDVELAEDAPDAVLDAAEIEDIDPAEGHRAASDEDEDDQLT